MKINDYYQHSIGGTKEDFIEFVKVNNDDLTDDDVNDIDFLIQKIAKNMFYFEDNISTAKSDYINLIGMLIKKGVIFENLIKK